MKKSTKIILSIIVLVPILTVITWATWYTYNRQTKIAQTEQCKYELEHPKPPEMMTGPGGKLMLIASVDSPCMRFNVIPSLMDIISGHIVFEDIPKQMKVNPYTFTDMLLGRYTIGINLPRPCDQSATTTDCLKLPPPQPKSQAYIPSNSAQPIEEWTTATDTPISFDKFSFTLPSGWHGSVYEKGYSGGLHLLAQKDLDKGSFVIDCPPDGKGLESAVTLSREERSFTTGTTTYSITFEHWTAPNNNPWIFIWLRSNIPGDFNTDRYGNVCIAQGGADPDVAEAMKKLYESWK